MPNNPMNYTKLTLGELLSSKNEIIRRNAVSILKQLQAQKGTPNKECAECAAITKTYLEQWRCANCGAHNR